jgi:uncharacterized protein (DUF433 family)
MDPSYSRITVAPNIGHGQPCVRGLRYPVKSLLDLIDSGMTFDEILGDHDDLERDHLLAVLRFAEFDAEGWTRQFERDISEGRPDALADEALNEMREGRSFDGGSSR